MDIATLRATEPTYPEVGRTLAAVTEGAPMPSGYSVVQERRLLGQGDRAFEAAAALVRDWGMHRGAGLSVTADGPAVTGTTLISRLGLGPVGLPAPCRVVWSVDEPGRAGFGYATLPGHPEVGEEGFLVTADPVTGDVWFDVASFSRAGRWYTRLAGPIARAGQRFFARRCATVLARAAAHP